MEKSLEHKLALLRQNPRANTFILADAKDADMAFGIECPGRTWQGNRRSIQEYRDQMREIVVQGMVDIVLMSASTSEVLALQEHIFDRSSVTPAVRANDTTDVHIVRGGRYATSPSKPFATTTIGHIQYGRLAPETRDLKPGVNLGLYSVTFNNDPECDLKTMEAYRAFRIEAEEKGFQHFLEVFSPNVPANIHGLTSEDIPHFVNDHIVRLLAGVPSSSRPRFLKIPYFGPAAMEEICGYDSSIVVGILGGSAGTTHDAFHLLSNAKKHGARVALFGRKINAAEHQLSFVEHLRRVADDEISPEDAVRSYHASLVKLGITPRRSLEQDLELTLTYTSYGE